MNQCLGNVPVIRAEANCAGLQRMVDIGPSAELTWIKELSFVAGYRDWIRSAGYLRQRVTKKE